jgi:hypothetical protein
MHARAAPPPPPPCSKPIDKVLAAAVGADARTAVAHAAITARRCNSDRPRLQAASPTSIQLEPRFASRTTLLFF